MNARDFRIGLRLLVKDPGYSAVVILGLSVAFAVCCLLFEFARYVLSYDAFVPDSGRIHLVKYKYNLISSPQWVELSPLPLLDVAERSGLVESATALNYMQVAVKVDALVESIEIAAVHPSFAQMFNVKTLDGDLRKALSHPDLVALTRSLALKLYGLEHVVGKTLQVGNKTLTVAAVLADPPSNSTVAYSSLVGIETTLWPADERKMLFQSWSYIYAKIYIKLKPNASAAVLSQILQEATEKSPLFRDLPEDLKERMKHKRVAEIRLGTLPDMYFDSDTADSPNGSQHGDIRVVYGLSSIALLILLMATINYVNLATVRILQRRREIAVRKVLGASIGRVAAQFLSESLLVSFVATAIGILFAYLLLPTFAALIDLQLEDAFTASTLLLSLILGGVIGVASALYPLWVAMRVRPSEAMTSRGASETISASWLRRLLTVCQFTAAIGLTGVTLTVAYQTRFALQSSPGFNTDPLLVITVPTVTSTPASRGFREALSHVPGVEGVCAAAGPLGVGFLGRFYSISRDDGTNASIVSRPITPNFFKVYGIRPLAGRLFSSDRDREDASDNVVLSAAALRPLNFASPGAAIGKVIRLGDGPGSISASIIGIAPDIQHEGLHKAVRPIVYSTSKDVSVMTVRTSGDVTKLADIVDGLQRQYFPNDVVEVRRASSYFSQSYAEDIRLVKLLAISSVIAICIAAFGIYVLAAYTVQRREREIVIRKLHGANSRSIGLLIAREFLMLTTLGAVVGLPIAWYATKMYLASFVELAPMTMLPLAASLLLIFAVALSATLRQTIRASRTTPALVLRTL